MRHSQKARYIICTCMLAVGIISAVILYKNFRPSAGLPYEVISPEQAQEYMEFEEGYYLLDIGTAEEFSENHLEGAVSIPYDQLLNRIVTTVPDKGSMIYLYGRDSKTADKAALKLCELGYVSVTRIGILADWERSEGADS